MTTSEETVFGGSPHGELCHDDYVHPMFWCEEKRRVVERRNAEESMRMWRRRKAEEMARKEREKQEYNDLFLTYCPWGRAGGGAPNYDVRRKDITAIGLHSTPTMAPSTRLTSFQSCPRLMDYFTQHKKCYDPITAYNHHHHNHHHLHQQPRVTTHTHKLHHHLSESTRPVAGSTVTICEREISGPIRKHLGGATVCAKTDPKIGELLEITLKDHPSMSFRNKGHLDIEVRYKPPPVGKGRPILEKIVITESDKCPANSDGANADKSKSTTTTTTAKSPAKKKLMSKMEKPPSKEPWGKSGPGGKPWRDPKASGGNLMKSLGWTNKEMLKDLDQDNPVTPAEKHTFRKVQRPAKKVQMLRCCDMCTCSCPALLSGNSIGGVNTGISPLKPQQKRTLPSSMSPHKNAAHNTVQAKIDTNKQKICPRLLRRAAGSNANTTGAGSYQQQTATDNSANGDGGGDGGGGNGGGVELVPLLARRRATYRPFSLSSTDVTKPSASHDRLPTAADLRYLQDLNEQMSMKRRSISAAQFLDRELSNQHFETFDTFWGRSGHGAPGEIKQKLKLDKLLYGDPE